MKPVCKRCYKTVSCKGRNPFNLVKHLSDRHQDFSEEYKTQQALITDHPENVTAINSWFLQFIREQLYFWLVLRRGWVMICGVCRWRTVAIVASVALVAAIVYYRKTR